MNFVDVVNGVRFIYDVKEARDNKKYNEEFFKLLFEQLDNKVLYVDSNVFMAKDNKGVDRFFKELLEYKDIKITMPTEQYEEIYNLKNSNNELKAKSARDAFSIIEKLFDSKNLNILKLNEELEKEKAYADPVFIRKIIENLKDEKKVFFITEDKDLRIRLKSKIESENLNESDVTICSFNTMYDDKRNLVDEERQKEKERKEDEEFLDGIINENTVRDKVAKKVMSWLS